MFDFLRTYQMDIMLALSAACVSFALLLFFAQFLNIRRKVILIAMEFSATFLLFFDRMAYIYSGDMSRTGYVMVRFSNFMVFFLTSAVVFVFNQYLIDLIADGDWSVYIPYRLRFIVVATILGMIFVIISQFTGWIYYFDENNVYHRGDGFLLSYIVPIVSPILQYTVIRQYKKKFSRLIYTSLVLYIFVPIICAFIQLFEYGISIVNMSIVLVSIFMYFFSYLDINMEVVRAHRIQVGELREGEQRMKRLFDQTTASFVKAIEKKDTYAEGHSKRVAKLARRIAQMAGKDEEKCDEVYHAALLHDVGMIGIPDSIIQKKEDLTPKEYEILRTKPKLSAEILADIEDYPYLMDGVMYSHERYDGSGYPQGLVGEEIPEIARIIAVADAYDSMITEKRYRDALPYVMVRETFVEAEGVLFDPEFAKYMIQIMDQEHNMMEVDAPLEKELVCHGYKEAVTRGILLSQRITKINFVSKNIAKRGRAFSAPSIIVFDSYNKKFHNNAKSIAAYRYMEYGEIWFDGHYNSTEARNMVVKVQELETDKTENGHLVFYNKQLARHAENDPYEISAARFGDHIRIKMAGGGHVVEATIALYDDTKDAYIGITGENCHIMDIVAVETMDKIGKQDIERISEEITFTDRIQSDIPNIQIDRTRSASTLGVKVMDDLRIYFHAMSLPPANLVWHCPYVVLFYSEDGQVGGPGYREYVLVKINGEIEGGKDFAENKFTMKKNDKFAGWDNWKTKLKSGVECELFLFKRGNTITVMTENMGVSIETTTIIKEDLGDVYVAITGDEVAITDIRVMK